MTRNRQIIVLAVFLFSVPIFGATFVVPADRDLPQRADGIVLGTVLDSYPQWSADGSIETLTVFSVGETIKGNVPATINIVEPGGSIDGVSVVISGVPHFAPGEEALLFLRRTGADRWAVADLAVGKFTSLASSGGRILQRDADDITGWDAQLKPFVDRPRDELRFLAFIRAVAAGRRDAAGDYFVDRSPFRPRAESLVPQPAVAPYSATSYTMNISGALGGRWAVFPNAVTFFSGTQTEPGAPGGGVTAIQAAFASWDNDCGSNVNYVYGGTDNGTHTQGLHGVDGANTILFERDLSAWGVAPFSCSGNSYSGTLGIGGITNASGTNSVSGETFSTTQEADVEMNRGIANCTLLFNNGDFNSAVTHEVGHTLGFRHSDQTRNSGAACTTDSSLECSNTAIMKSFISTGLNAALQVWDQHAVQAVYPGNVCAPTQPPPTCTAPSITAQPASTTITAGQSATLSVGVSGTAPFSYQWYIGTSGNTASPISGATGPSLTVSPAVTTSYWARVTNSCGTANSATAVVTVNATAVARMRRSDFNGDGNADILWRNPQTGQIYIYLMRGLTIITQGSPGTVTDPAFQIVGTGDLDGDGRSDILWRNSTTGQNWVWFMNGVSIINQGGIAGMSDVNWKVAGVADFNGDGRGDILWRNNSTGVMAMYLLNGLSVIGSGNIGTVTDPNWLIFTGDFDGDRKSDILWRHTVSGQNYVWFQNGLSRVSEGTIDTVATVWKIGTVTDLNGDGKSDIVFRNSSSGQVWVYLMNGLIRANQGSPGTVADLNFDIVAGGDYDANGTGDLLWRESATGQNYIWFMNGFSIMAQGQVDVVAPQWRVVW
ncbi:MAG: FG-GAP-like repeat-containing protein [Thermoanaerobaculia bacterium]